METIYWNIILGVINGNVVISAEVEQSSADAPATLQHNHDNIG